MKHPRQWGGMPRKVNYTGAVMGATYNLEI
jgi:hypothetical protein